MIETSKTRPGKNMARNPLLRNVEPRIYQETIFAESINQNTLIVLPTGLGKTVIIAYAAAYTLQKNPDLKILITTPTRPLIHQTAESMRNFIAIEEWEVLEVSGAISPAKRKKAYLDARIIVSTPQTIDNDLQFSRLNPKEIGLICIDEAHRATGNYAFVKIVDSVLFENERCQILGFTATPGNSREQVLEVVKNLHIEKVVTKGPEDTDVKEYISIHSPKIIWINLPKSYSTTLSLLKDLEGDIVNELKNQGLQLNSRYISKKDALELQQRVVQLMQEDPGYGGLLVYTANLIRTLHVYEIIETQGFAQAAKTIKQWRTDQQKKSLVDFLNDARIREMGSLVEENKDTEPHPKLAKLISLLNDALKIEDSKIIVFSNYRNTIHYLHEELNKSKIYNEVFIGQSSAKGSKGLSQKEQIAVLKRFKDEDLNILLSTSVGEEGLDVGNCDLVVFYDSVPSIVRSIQRTGRGRKRESRVIRLITKNTKDASMYYAIKRREKIMQDFLRLELPPLLSKAKTQKNLDKFMDSSSSEPKKQVLTPVESAKSRSEEKIIDNSNNVENLGSLNAESVEEIKDIEGEGSVEPVKFEKKGTLHIIVDNREAKSIIPRALKRQGATLSNHNLPVGDYLVSDRVVIERKTTEDFIGSLVERRRAGRKPRLFDQAAKLRYTYQLPVMIIEGQWESARRIHPNSIRGAIISLLLDFRIAVLFSENAMETADMILNLAKREQTERKARVIAPVKSSLPIEEIQAEMLTAIPGINLNHAHSLLNAFGSIKNLSLASEEELLEVQGIGKTLAERVLKILNTSFKLDEENNNR
ncbi:MAG: ERCC4 domain-containing protein [Candidatus Hodarchaeota archaeon]